MNQLNHKHKVKFSEINFQKKKININKIKIKATRFLSETQKIEEPLFG